MDKDALYAAAFAGDADAIAKLEMQADTLNRYEETILHVESENGNTERVRFILREFAHKNLLAKLTYTKLTALHYAAYKGHTEVASILIDAARHLPVTSFQAFLRQPQKHMDTALHIAVRKGHASIVKLLVEDDPSDTHIQNKEGKTPIYIAAERGYIDIVKVICTTCTKIYSNLDGPGGSTALHAAIKNLHKARKEDIADVIRLIIEAVKRANNHLDEYEKVRRLVELFNRTDGKGCMILELAVEGNYLDVVEFILAENPNLIGIMPLIHKARDKEYNDMVNLLTQTYQYQRGGVQTLSEIFELDGDMPKLISAIGSPQEGLIEEHICFWFKVYNHCRANNCCFLNYLYMLRHKLTSTCVVSDIMRTM